MSKTIRTTVLIIGITSLSFSSVAFASGYHQGIQSVSMQGMANSNAAEAEDATVLFYNPAGATHLPGTHISGGLAAVVPNFKFSRMSSSGYATNPGTGAVTPVNITGSNASNPAIAAWVPNLYLTQQLDDQWFMGLAVFVQFGDNMDFNQDWIGRYNGVTLDLKTVAINPSVSFKFDDHWSFGAGITAQYMDAEFIKAINPANPSNMALDNKLKYTGDDWAYGYNLGATLTVDETLRFGAAYRSEIKHDLHGDTKLSYSPYASPIGTVKRRGTVELKTPDSFSVNFYKKLTSELGLAGDYTYTWHSKFHDLTLESSAIPAMVHPDQKAVIDQDWGNTNRLSLGLDYQVDEPLKLRFGVAYDQSPVPSSTKRIANLPDNDRTWLSLGMKYAFTQELSLDAAYTYVLFEDSNINYTELDSHTTLNAKVKGHAQIFGLQLNYAI